MKNIDCRVVQLFLLSKEGKRNTFLQMKHRFDRGGLLFVVVVVIVRVIKI